jgi:branched-chain amino acid transport system substrate-binding protein
MDTDTHTGRTSNRHRRRAAFSGAALTLSLLAAACGSDSGSSDATTVPAGTTATTAAAAPVTTGAAAPATTGAAAPATTAEPANKDPYKIAYMGPLSGTLAGLGTSQLKAITSLVDQTNKAGGVNGHPIELLSEDDATDPAKGITAARSLIDKGVIAIVGPPVSSISVAVLPTTTRANVSIVTVGASPDSLNPVQKTLFQVDQTSASQAVPMTGFAADLLGKKDFKAQLGPIDTPSGLAWGENVKKLAATAGYTVLGTTPIPVAPGDVTALAQKLVQGSPEVILVEMTDVPYVSMVQKLRDLGYKGPIINFQGGSSATVFNSLKDPDVYGARTYNHYDPTSTEPGEMAFVAAAKAAGTEQTAQSASLYGSVYGAGLAVLGAIATCGDTCDAGAVTDALGTLELDTKGFTFNPLKFSADSHQTMSDEVFFHWDGSKVAAGNDGKVYSGDVYTKIG